MFPYATEDCRAELVVYCHDGWCQYNAAYLRDGGTPNVGWESLGIFPSVHDALEEGKRFFEDAKLAGYKRGALTSPWTFRKVA